MDTGNGDRGARRRAWVRWWLGKPGSRRRWLVGSIVTLFLTVLYVLVSFNVFAFVPILVLIAVAYTTRWIKIGDEDEFQAGVTRAIVSAVKYGPPPPGEHVDSAEWFTRGPNRFVNAPPPPWMDETVNRESGSRGTGIDTTST